MQLNEEQMDNLKKLQSYLKGELKARFDMFTYSDDPKNCGSIGCAIGHGPYAGVEKFENESWPNYAERCFGSSHRRRPDRLYKFLFDSDWARYDNTPEGVVRRIQYVFDHGVPVIESVHEAHQLMKDYNV